MGSFFLWQSVVDDGGLVAMGGWRIQVKMLDGKLFDGDEMEIHGGGGTAWKPFVGAFSWFVG